MTAHADIGSGHPPPLGVGCTVLPSHLAALDAVRDLLDVVEVDLGSLARELSGPTPGTRLRPDRDLVDALVRAVGGLPVVVHGSALSIGTAAGWNRDAVDLLDDVGRIVRYRWHSEHVGFLSARDRTGAERSAGIPLPLPYTAGAASLVAARADLLARRTGRPFLLGNVAHHLPDLPHDPGWDEATFLTELCRRSSCGLVLDLSALHANSRDHGRDPHQLLGRIPLERVVQVRLAGAPDGLAHRSDRRPGEVPEPVWALLATVMEQAPRVAAVVFQLGDEPIRSVAIDEHRSRLERVRYHWDRRCGRPVTVRS